MTDQPSYVPETEPVQARQGIPLPLARPVATNILLGLIVVVFLIDNLLRNNLLYLGAQINADVAAGAYWQLLSAMFLHVGLMHILFNGWALFSLGREVEAVYGSARFLVIYFLAGLFGGLAFFLLGEPNVPSAGASGAIFGLIGAEIAFFLRNRRLFGNLSRQQLSNLLLLVVINLIFGFTARGVINNYAHLGGLISGFLLGSGLSPHYAVRWEGLIPTPRLVNRTSFVVQVCVTFLAVILLIGGVRYGDQLWAGRLPGLRTGSQTMVLDRRM